LLRSIGPELISGASDNDPTNVGTAVAVGATTTYQLAWLALLVAPLLGVVQTIAAQVGAVARNDLQTLTLKRYGRGVAAILLVSVVIVNVVTIAADLQAGAAGIGLLAGVDSRWLVVPLGLALVGLQLVGKYDEVVGVLRYLLFGFLAFGVAAFLAHPDWSRVLKSSLVPSLSLHRDVVAGGLALLGTTLTSYVYVWETIGRGREEAPATTGAPVLARARIGAVIGAIFTAVILWFMLIASAATLGEHHQTVTSAQDAALALRPLAGSLAATVFTIGLVTSAVVALPVLMATSAYVVGAQFDWRRGLSEQVNNAWVVARSQPRHSRPLVSVVALRIRGHRSASMNSWSPKSIRGFGPNGFRNTGRWLFFLTPVSLRPVGLLSPGVAVRTGSGRRAAASCPAAGSGSRRKV